MCWVLQGITAGRAPGEVLGEDFVDELGTFEGLWCACAENGGRTRGSTYFRVGEVEVVEDSESCYFGRQWESYELWMKLAGQTTSMCHLYSSDGF